jgi:hypothetical protein
MRNPGVCVALSLKHAPGSIGGGAPVLMSSHNAMAHTIPFQPIESEVLCLVARAAAVSFDTLVGRFEGRSDAEEIARIVASLQRNGMVDVAQAQRCAVVSITTKGQLRAAEESCARS